MAIQNRSWLFVLFLIGICSCTPEVREKLKPVPNAFGSRNQIVVVTDSSLWNSAIGDTFRYYYASAYPVLPQPEPIFDLKLYTPDDLSRDPKRRELRNYIILTDLADEDSPTTLFLKEDLGSEKLYEAKEDKNVSTVVGMNKWAKNQLLIYLFSYGKEELEKQIKRNFPAIKRRVDKANDPKIAANIYINGTNRTIETELEENFLLKSKIPDKYFIAYDQENTMWIRRETPVSSTNIMIHKEPYTRQEQLGRAHLKGLRDSLGRKLVSTEIDGTYMKINDLDLPMFIEPMTLNGNYAVEARGIWEMVNDYLGGPFVSYVTVNPKTNELYFFDGFVYAPGKEKREFMQDIEYVIRTFQFL